MHEVKIKRVVSCSSEEKDFPAQNLLNAKAHKPWKSTGEAGSTRATVILELEKSASIQQLEIGNESSAFIEVLVGSSASADDDYQTLLPAASFMTPDDSKLNRNTHRTRQFSADTFDKAVCSKKWDRLKIVCTQLYNKNLRFGLSFVTVFASGDPDNASTQANESKSSEPVKHVAAALGGKFRLRDDSTTTGSIAPGSMFQSRKQEHTDAPVPLSATIRAANEGYLPTSQSRNSGVAEDSGTKPKFPKSTSSSSQQERTAVPKTFQKKQLPSSSKRAGVKGSESSKPTTSRGNSQAVSDTVSKTRDLAKQWQAENNQRKRKSAEKTQQKSAEKTQKRDNNLPFGELLNGVTFVLSGFENPYRSELRDKALEMGATYSPQWNANCTHLICAFHNTPKYNEVKEKGGKIVRKEWILDCFSKRQALPYRNYTFESPPASLDGSEEEEDMSEEDEEDWEPSSDEESDSKKQSTNKKQKLSKRSVAVATPKYSPHSKRAAAQKAEVAISEEMAQEEKSDTEENNASKGKNKKAEKAPSPERSTSGASSSLLVEKENETGHVTKTTENSYDIYNASTDDNESSSSGGNTDDEIRRVKQKQQQTKKEQPRQSVTPEKSLVASLRKEHFKKSPSPKKKHLEEMPDLPDFFEGMVFFLYGSFPDAEMRQLKRFITAYDGELHSYMDDEVTHVIARNGEWNEEFEKESKKNSKLVFLKADWILECGKSSKKVDINKYLIKKP